MTSEAARARPIIFNIKSYPCMPKPGSHSIQGIASHSWLAPAEGRLKLISEAAGTRPIISTSKVTPVCPKQGAIPYRA